MQFRTLVNFTDKPSLTLDLFDDDLTPRGSVSLDLEQGEELGSLVERMKITAAKAYVTNRDLATTQAAALEAIHASLSYLETDLPRNVVMSEEEVQSIVNPAPPPPEPEQVELPPDTPSPA